MLSMGWILTIAFFAASLRLIWLMSHAWEGPSRRGRAPRYPFQHVAYPFQHVGAEFGER